MSKNPLYANEIATAHQFVIEHNTDCELMNFLRQVQNDMDRSHSSHWSKIYDYMGDELRSLTEDVVYSYISTLCYSGQLDYYDFKYYVDKLIEAGNRYAHLIHKGY